MKRETLFNHQCIAIASPHGLGGLYELAQHLHMEKGIRRGDDTINMDYSDDPTCSVGFWFNPAAGDGGVIVATAGASFDENGLEGVRFLFESHEVAAAQKALLAELNSHEPHSYAPSFSVV